MKKLLSSVLGSSLLATGIISVSATSTLAGQTATDCNINNIFGSVVCADAEDYGDGDVKDEGSDLDGWLDTFFVGKNPSITNLTGPSKSSNKIDGYNGSDSYYSISSTDGTSGNITFLQDINNAFAFTLKASSTWSAYLFDTGVKEGDTLSWTMDGVAQNQNGEAAQLSHASLFLTDIPTLPAVVDDPVVDDPVANDPVVDDPVVDDPVANDPVVDDPVVDDPVVDDPVVDDPVAVLEPVAVPEPASLAGLALVAAALGFSKRKQA